MAHKRTPCWLDPDLCFGAFPPLAAGTGMEIEKLWSYLSQWHYQQDVITVHGIPDKALMMDATGNGCVHFATYWPDQADTENRQHGIIIKEWSIDRFPGGGASLPWGAWWIPDFAGAPAVEFEIVSGYGVTSTDQTYGETAGGAHHAKMEGPEGKFLIRPAAGAYVHSAIRLEYMNPASLAVFPCPQQPPLTLTQEQASLYDFAPGRVIRGHDTIAGALRSLGTMTRIFGDGTTADEGVESLGRRVLWSFAHPVGLYETTLSGGVTFWMTPEINVQPRNLVGTVAGLIATEPVLVITADEDVEIKITSDADLPNPWIYTVPAGGVTTQMITPADGLPVTGVNINTDAATGLRIDISAPSDNEEIVIHSFQLFEGPGWA